MFESSWILLSAVTPGVGPAVVSWLLAVGTCRSVISSWEGVELEVVLGRVLEVRQVHVFHTHLLPVLYNMLYTHTHMHRLRYSNCTVYPCMHKNNCF